MLDTTNIQVKSDFSNHPFKEGVALLLNQYFAPSIADRFYCVLEAEKYSAKSQNMKKQLREQVYVMEVYFNQKNGMSVYICDLLSRWPKAFTEAHLLRHITDKIKSNQINEDWIEDQGKISSVVTSGKLETILDAKGDPINY